MTRDLNLALIIALIVVGGGLMFFGQTRAAALAYSLSLIAIVLLEVYKGDRIYKALALVPLFSLFTASTPVFLNNALYSYLFAYVSMIIPIYVILHNRWFSLEEVGISEKRALYLIPIGSIIGFILGSIEYQIQGSEVLQKMEFLSALELSVAVILIAGFVEEFIFRSMLQTELENRLGKREGLIVASLLFGITYSTYGTLSEVGFGLFSGLAIGYLFQRFRSLPFVVAIHCMANISLFLIVPNLTYH